MKFNAPLRPALVPAGPAPQESDTAAIQPNQRIVVVDIVRGFALFGVLMLNLLSFSGPTLTFEAWAGSNTWWDRTVELVLLVAGEAAFYSTFSFLFGVGVALQVQRADARHAPFAVRHLSRMAVLFGFGLLHAVFIWDGDILVQYSVAGCFLLPFARRKSETVLAWAVGLSFVVAALMLMVGLMSLLGSPEPTAPSAIRADVDLYGSGSFVELTKFRLGEIVTVLIEALLASMWFVSIFLVGVWAVSSGKVTDWRNQRQFLRKVLKVSLPLALTTKTAYGVMILSQSVRVLDNFAPLLSAFVAGPALGASFTCLLLLHLQRRSGATFLRYLAPVGRMALTNYLLQSVVAVTVFYGFGFGLYGQVGIAAAAGFGVVLFAVQAIFSVTWLSFFKFGPMEWLWRTLSYRQNPSKELGGDYSNAIR